MNLSRVLFAWVLLSPAVQGAEQAAGLDQSNAWFKPALIENRSTICSAVLEEANRLFYSPVWWIDRVPIQVKDMEVIDPETGFEQEQITEPHPNTGKPMQRTQAFVTTHSRKIYVDVRNWPRSETQQMFAYTKPFEAPIWADDDTPAQSTPDVPAFTLLRSRDGLYHVALVEDRQLQVFMLTENAAWDRVCKVSIEPESLRAEADEELQSARQSIHDLQLAVDALRQGETECGTLRAHERGGQFMNRAFHRAFYRPWVGASEQQALLFQDTKTDSLTAWSLIGFDEYAAVAKFRSQLPVTVRELARFYTREFRWSQADSALAAERAVAAAVRHGLAISSAPMTKDGSLAVKQAILENRSVAELQALNWNPEARKHQWSAWNESELSIAVKHPAALRWLLSKGLDPNHANAFGKTPLMYAAQHNALEAVRILLEHGADPNAGTIFPEDTCTYALRRANVTALHYAARYGSAEVLEALVAAGALTVVKTVDHDEPAGHTPLEWLGRFASPNIADADRPRLEQLLRPLAGEELLQYSERQTLQAQKQYAAGDMKAAHRSIKNALHADPSNARALSDLSLLALKAGNYGESLEAATRLIAQSQDARMVANAWFNVGLACERSGHRYLAYNGKNYCASSIIFPFLQSWLAASSRARAEKLEQLLTAPGDKRCVVPQPDSTEHRYVFAKDDNPSGPDIQRIYVLHPLGSVVSASQVRWVVTHYTDGSVPRAVTPRLVGSHRLERSTITVLESEDEVQRTVNIGDYKCF